LETERAAQLLVAGLLDEPWRNSAAQCWCAGDERPALLTAGVLAAVKSDTRDGRSLAWHVGHAAGSGGTPPMSEVRFKRLLKATTLGEFFTAARRAVVLANGARGGTDVAVLADDLMAWAFEHSSGWRDRPAQTMCFRWAQDYYQPLKGKDADLAADDKLTEGDRA
jgi:CRISPR type I-E-associated protein CasB/Cse2